MIKLIAFASLFITHASASSLGFKEAFLKLKSVDPRLQASALSVKSAETTALAAKLTFLPTLSASADRRWQGAIDRNRRLDTLSAVAELNLFAFGRDYYNLKASGHSLKSQERALDQVELQVEKEIFSALLEFIVASENVKILDEIERLKNDILKVTEARFKRGLDPSSELLRAQVEVANANARTQSARSELSLVKAKLDSLSDTAVEIKASWPLDLTKQRAKMKQLLEEKFDLGKRPDFQKANYQVLAISAQKRSLISEYLPALNFSVARNYTENYLNEWETTYMLSVKFTLFSGGSTLQKRDQLEAQRALALSDMILAKRSAPESFRAQVQNLERGHETLEARLRTLGLSTKLYQENLSLFKKGRRPLFELLLDQERMLSSKQLANIGQRDFYSAMMNVCLELGSSLEDCLF